MPPLKLEVFEPAPTKVLTTVVLTRAEVEEAKLQSYEAGYAAGWEDAAAAARQEQAHIGSELALNLRQLSYTHEEARTELLASLQPVLVQLCTQLLPSQAKAVLASVVRETLMPLLHDQTEAKVRVVLNPSARSAVEPVLLEVANRSFQIVEEPTLGDGQVYLQFGGAELCVDLDRAVRDITRAVQDFLEYHQKDRPHG